MSLLKQTLPTLRGRWDIQRQLTGGGPAGHTFAVRYDEFTADTPLNQVFRFVVERLLSLTQVRENQALLAHLRDWFDPVTLLPHISPAFLAAVRLSRLDERFAPSFNLARLFLSGQAVIPVSGQVQACAFTLDMSQLFERFVAAFLQRHRSQVLPEAWQGAAVVPQWRGAYLARSDGQDALRLQPDLLILRQGGSTPLLIADTKYKLLDPAQRQAGVLPEDIYQMVAYAVRLGCPRILLLYPQVEATGPLRKRFSMSSIPAELHVCTINLRIPLHRPELLIHELSQVLYLTSQEVFHDQPAIPLHF